MKFNDLEGRVAAVTGGARGLGFSAAEAFAQQGCAVALFDILSGVGSSVGRHIADWRFLFCIGLKMRGF